MTKLSFTLTHFKGEIFCRDIKHKASVQDQDAHGGRSVRDCEKIVALAAFQKREDETSLPSHAQPDRRWFGGFYFIIPSSFGVLSS
jgi:hypothetical protein